MPVFLTRFFLRDGGRNIPLDTFFREERGGGGGGGGGRRLGGGGEAAGWVGGGGVGRLTLSGGGGGGGRLTREIYSRPNKDFRKLVFFFPCLSLVFRYHNGFG